MSNYVPQENIAENIADISSILYHVVLQHKIIDGPWNSKGGSVYNL